jgi:hypothetical protein
MTIPSGQSAWTFNSALHHRNRSASVLTGLLMGATSSGDVFVIERRLPVPGRRLSGTMRGYSGCAWNIL